MPAKRLPMRQVRDVLRLKHACGMSERVIARTRRLKIIPNAFGEKAVLKLVYDAMIRAAERCR